MDTHSTHGARLLCLDDSWRADAVSLRLDERRVEIPLAHVGSSVSCPACGQSCGLADHHAHERRRGHVNAMQFTTELVARLPRCRFPDHGVRTTVHPWAGRHSRLTLFFQAFAIEALQACRAVKDVASLLGLSWDTARTIMNRAIERGLERCESTLMLRVGIDETSVGKGQDSVPILTGNDGSRVQDVALERTQAAAEAVLLTLTVQRRRRFAAIRRNGLKTAPGLGDEGGVPLVPAACAPDECRGVPQPVARLGRALPPPPRHQGGEDAQSPSAERSDPLPPPRHHRHERELQQRHPSLEVRRPRLPALRDRQNAEPVLSRETRPRAAATLPLKCRKNHFRLPIDQRHVPLPLRLLAPAWHALCDLRLVPGYGRDAESRRGKSYIPGSRSKSLRMFTPTLLADVAAKQSHGGVGDSCGGDDS